MKDCRYIKIDDEKIIFINPVFPFIRATRYWKDFDYKELKDSIVVKNNGRLRIGKFKQLACLLGMKI